METVYSRTELLLGTEGVQRLKKSHVAIFGIGGVGSFTAEALARAGVGELTLVDKDTVSLSNCNRQLIALQSTVGLPKVMVMRDRIFDINPEIQIHTVQALCLPENIEEFFDKNFDYVVDAVDTVSAKIALAETAGKYGVPIISAMGAGNKLNPALFETADIFETSVCPLCRVMRRELKKRNISGLKVVYSKEEPIRPSSGQGDTRKVSPGSVSFVPSVCGLILAGEVVQDLSGKPMKK